MNIQNMQVAIKFIEKKKYPDKIPFDPPENYPEYKVGSIDTDNEVYAGVRETFHLMGLDSKNYGKENWNPLGQIVKPGMTVFLKPNTVVHEHEENKDLFSIITHASVIRPILDYVCIALKDSGKIIIGDSQFLFSFFDKGMKASYIEDLLKWYRMQTEIPIECIDLRSHEAVKTYLFGKWGRRPITQDKRGYKFVDLGKSSHFEGIDPDRLRIAFCSHKVMKAHHAHGKHEYQFPQSFLDSDVVINIPKLKTHRRTALTVALKNFMGLPSMKDTLPHYIVGSPKEGGDEYIHASFRKKITTALHDQIQSSPYIPVKFICDIMKRLIWKSHLILPFKDDVDEGMWPGNDTVWRTLFDLNNIAFFADKDGVMHQTQQRQFLCLVDGVVAGENDGPLIPDPVDAGVFVGGYNPVAVDAVSATLMGFDIDKIPLICKGFKNNETDPDYYLRSKDDIQIVTENGLVDFNTFSKQEQLNFEPHPNWKGRVELN